MSNGISIHDWVTARISVSIHPTRQLNRVFADEPCQFRRVIPCAVVVQPTGIAFPPRVLIRVVVTGAALRGGAVGIVVVPLDRIPIRIGQQPGAAQPVGQEIGTSTVIVARIALVDAQAGQDWVDRRSLRFLYGVPAVVQVLRGRATLGLGGATTQCVVAVTGNDSPALTDLAQVVAVVPGVGSCAVRKQVAVGVVAHGDAIGLGLPVVVVEDVIGAGRW